MLYIFIYLQILHPVHGGAKRSTFNEAKKEEDKQLVGPATSWPALLMIHQGEGRAELKIKGIHDAILTVAEA